MADMHTPLLPCPYCGGSKTQTNTKAKSYFIKKQAERAGKDTSNYIVRCTACGAKGPLCHSAGDAIAAWNRRAPSQDAETIKALREALMKAGQSAGFQYMTAETRAEIEAALANAPRCEHCDGTGDVHRADGEWLGTCTCAAGLALAGSAS